MKKTLKKAKFGPLWTPFALNFFFGGSSADSPLKIWDVITPYLKTLFEQKNRKFIILTIFA